MRGARAPLLLLLAWAGLAAAAYDAIILKIAEGEFAVQSGEDLGQPVGDRLRRLRLPQGADVEAELVRLRSLKSVEWAHPDMPIRSAAVNVDDSAPIPHRVPPNPKGYRQQWGMQRIGMPAAWAVATGAASKDTAVKLCLVDSGVDLMHPDLAANVAGGFNAVNGEDPVNFIDLWGHGTEVSGVIAGTGANGGAVGVNWNNINLVVCRFMDATGYGSTSDAVQCLDWCMQQNASVISASWTSGVLDNPPLQEAVARTEKAGALMVVSAGNQGLNMKRAKLYPQAYAARHENMLVVGATDMFDDHVSYSNFDTKIVHLHAPGDYIFTTKRGGGFVYASGTSIAAPFASSSAALLLAVARDRLNKTLSALELKQLLMDSVEVLPGLQGKSATGGRLRTDWAVQKLLDQPLSPKTKCLERPGTNKCEKERQQEEAARKAAEEEAARKAAEEEAARKAAEEEAARKKAEEDAAAKAEAQAALDKATAESMTEAAPSPSPAPAAQHSPAAQPAPSPSPSPATQPLPASQPAPSPQPAPVATAGQPETAPATAVHPSPAAAGGEQVPAAGVDGTQPVAAPSFTVVIHGPALEFPGNRKAPALGDDPPVAPKPRGPNDSRPVPRSTLERRGALEVHRVMLQDGVAELPAGAGMPAVQLRSPLEGLSVEEKAARIFGRRPGSRRRAQL